MPKTGRNDPCHCGSGKKYKRCCLGKDEAVTSAALETQRAAAAAAAARELEADLAMFDEDELTQASNAVVDLVHDGKLDTAESLALALLARFPEVHDGYDRLGMVYEARGDNKKAAYYYRKVIEFVAAHPDTYDAEFADTFRKLVDRLDPPGAST